MTNEIILFQMTRNPKVEVVTRIPETYKGTFVETVYKEKNDEMEAKRKRNEEAIKMYEGILGKK